jgi:hypothetical protein
MQTEKPQVQEAQGREYGCGVSGAEQRVGAEKFPTKGWSKGAVSWGLIQSSSNGRSPMSEAKPFCISKNEVWEAYQRVKANKGAAGVDDESIEDFEGNVKDNLYKVWNRMSSGSYLPPPVRTVKIPKKNGGERKLGIPTVVS